MHRVVALVFCICLSGCGVGPVIALHFAHSHVGAGSGTPPVLRNRTSASRKDHTLEVLAVVHQLVDLDESAGDLRLTPSVQVLP